MLTQHLILRFILLMHYLAVVLITTVFACFPGDITNVRCLSTDRYSAECGEWSYRLSVMSNYFRSLKLSIEEKETIASDYKAVEENLYHCKSDIRRDIRSRKHQLYEYESNFQGGQSSLANLALLSKEVRHRDKIIRLGRQKTWVAIRESHAHDHGYRYLHDEDNSCHISAAIQAVMEVRPQYWRSQNSASTELQRLTNLQSPGINPETFRSMLHANSSYADGGRVTYFPLRIVIDQMLEVLPKLEQSALVTFRKRDGEVLIRSRIELIATRPVSELGMILEHNAITLLTLPHLLIFSFVNVFRNCTIENKYSHGDVLKTVTTESIWLKGKGKCVHVFELETETRDKSRYSVVSGVASSDFFADTNNPIHSFAFIATPNDCAEILILERNDGAVAQPCEVVPVDGTLRKDGVIIDSVQILNVDETSAFSPSEVAMPNHPLFRFVWRFLECWTSMMWK